MSRFRTQSYTFGLIGLTLILAGCGASGESLSAPEELMSQTVNEGVIPDGDNRPNAAVEIESVDSIGATISADATLGFYPGVDTSHIPGYEYLDQAAIDIGFLMCPLYFRTFAQ
ncbi:MAG: hypothetical protein O3C10_06615 [Chloroflexi bacterium]|nr:hypothetical protein [Chloroflexota bacterium]